MTIKTEIRWPGFVQLFLLLIQTAYLVLFWGNIANFIDFLAFYGEAMIGFSLLTSILAIIAYIAGFFKNPSLFRILFAVLLLAHIAVAFYCFYITIAVMIGRC